MSETTQQAIVQKLREWILSGELMPGTRLVEAHIAQRLGISRTPLRYALSVLSGEGLLERTGARGYVVRRFGVSDVLNAIDVRGVLEGLAARTVAQRRVPPSLEAALLKCLADGDAIFRQPALRAGDEAVYASMNGEFHRLIVNAAGNDAVSGALSLNGNIPFVMPSTVVFEETARELQFSMLMYAHRQHHAIVDAILEGDGARAEALMKEHTNISKKSLNLSSSKLHLISGAS